MIMFLAFGAGLVPGILVREVRFERLCRHLLHLSAVALIFLIGYHTAVSGQLVRSLAGDICASFIMAAVFILGSIVFTAVVLAALKRLKRDDPAGETEDVGSEREYESPAKPGLQLVLINAGAIVFGFCTGSFIHFSAMNRAAAQSLTVLLAAFVFIIGIETGFEIRKLFCSSAGKGDAFRTVRRDAHLFLLLPFAVISGTMAAAILSAPLAGLSWKEGLVVASPLGWQTLGGPVIVEIRGVRLGSIAFMANMFRDVLSLLVIPFLGRIRMPLLALAPGGVSTMDILLPSALASAGEKHILLALWTGGTCAVWAPVLIYVTNKI